MLTASFDRTAVRLLLPPPAGKLALMGELSAEWGCEGTSLEHQATLNAAWVVEADGVLTQHYTSFFDSLARTWAQLWQQASGGPAEPSRGLGRGTYRPGIVSLRAGAWRASPAELK